MIITILDCDTIDKIKFRKAEIGKVSDLLSFWDNIIPAKRKLDIINGTSIAFPNANLKIFKYASSVLDICSKNRLMSKYPNDNNNIINNVITLNILTPNIKYLKFERSYLLLIRNLPNKYKGILENIDNTYIVNTLKLVVE